MSNCKILFHHGSPGTSEDFDVITEKLDKLTTYKLRRFDEMNLDGPIVEVGYSWGCFYALKNALKHSNNVSAIILIAPYLFPTKVGAFKKLIIKNKKVGDIIINKASSKSIEQHLITSSYPDKVPNNYKQAALKYTSPDLIRESLLEKDVKKSEIKELLSKVKELNIPIYVIRGSDDKTSNGEEQINQIREFLKIKQEAILADKGHALLWTATSEVASFIEEVSNSIQGNQKLGYADGESKLNNVCSFLEEHLEKNPKKEVLCWVSPENRLKWAENPTDKIEHDSVDVEQLHYTVGKLAGGLKNQGIQKGDRVIVFIPMSFPMYAMMFALQKIGAIAVFLDSWARRDQLNISAEVVSPKAVISFEKAFQFLDGIESIDKIDLKISVGPCEKTYSTSFEKLMSEQTWSEIEPVEKEHTALITFTTGSSGTPKGADRSHRFLASQHYALNRHIPYKSDDIDIPAFPIFSLNNLAAGVTTTLPAIDVGAPNPLDAPMLIAQIKTMNVSCTTLSPSLMNALSSYCNEHKIILNELRRIITGGAPVSKDDVRHIKQCAPHAEVLILYGSTEVEPMAHINDVDMLKEDKLSKDPQWVDEGVNVGRFDEGLQVKFLKIERGPVTISSKTDWSYLEVPKGHVGEIIVSGEHVCERYYNNEEAFYKSKIVDVDGTIWHRTGDLGRFDSNDNLWIVGRIHNAIERDGQYLFPVRAEVILKRMPFTKHVAFLGMKDNTIGEATYAVFSAKEGIDSNFEQWEKQIQSAMDKNDIPVDKIVQVDEIPMDPRHHSKVEYAKLKEQLLKRELSESVD